MRLSSPLFGLMSLRRTAQRSLGLQGVCFCRLILTNSDRRAEAPKRGQDHKSHPSRCMMGRQSPPDDLQVPIDFPSSGASPPPCWSCPGHHLWARLWPRTRICSVRKNMQRRLIQREALSGNWSKLLWRPCSGHRCFTVPISVLECPFSGIERSGWWHEWQHLSAWPHFSSGFGLCRWHCGVMSRIWAWIVDSPTV